MGVSTIYKGTIKIKEIVPENVYNYINSFSKIRHMKRDNEEIRKNFPDYYKNIFGFTLGSDGEFWVDEKAARKNIAILDYNKPPETQPGLYCQWILRGAKCEDGYEDVVIKWNNYEKFYEGNKWLKYIIDNFLSKRNLHCEGVLSSIDDLDGVEYIFVINNKIKSVYDYEKATRLLYLLQNKGYLKNETIKHPVELKKEMEIWYGEMFI